MDAGTHVVEVLKYLEKVKKHQLCVVECGTIRNPTFTGHEDGLATYQVAEYLQNAASWPHHFYSFELSVDTLEKSRSFLGPLNAYVEYGLGDATLLLQHFNRPIDLCYLDAGASPFENLAQYRYASQWLDKPGAIIIDDVFDKRNADRGLVTVPYARMEGRKVACLSGRQALISFGIDDMPLPEGSYWL